MSFIALSAAAFRILASQEATKDIRLAGLPVPTQSTRSVCKPAEVFLAHALHRGETTIVLLWRKGEPGAQSSAPVFGTLEQGTNCTHPRFLVSKQSVQETDTRARAWAFGIHERWTRSWSSISAVVDDLTPASEFAMVRSPGNLEMPRTWPLMRSCQDSSSFSSLEPSRRERFPCWIS